MSLPVVRRLRLALLSLSALAIACGSHSSNSSGSAAASAVTSAAPVASQAPPAPIQTRVELLASIPAHGATRVAATQRLELVFDQPIDPASLGLGLVAESGGQPLTISAIASQDRVFVDPAPRWPAGASVTLNLLSELKSLAGDSARPARLGFEVFAGPTPAARLPIPAGTRSGAALDLLVDGRVLTAGGYGPAPLAAADLFDPATGELSATGDLHEARGDHSATALRDGRLLVAGGAGAAPLATLELYEPSTGAWRRVPAALASPRLQHEAFLLPSGRVAFVGGMDAPPHQGGRPLGTIEVFDPVDESLTTLPGPAFPPSDWVDLGDGRLLNLTASLVIDLERPGAPVPTQNALSVPRSYLAAARLPSGRILLAGGASGFGGAGQPVLHAEVDEFDPQTLTFASVAPLTSARFGAAACVLGDGRVAILGGAVASAGPPLGASTLELREGGATTIVPTPPMDGLSAVALERGGLLVSGYRSLHADLSSGSALALHYPAGSFERAPRPAELSGWTASGARRAAHPAGVLSLEFSLPVEVASLSSATVSLWTSGGEAVAASLVPEGRTVYLVPRAPLASDASYTIRVDALRVGGSALGPLECAVRTRAALPLARGALLIVDKPTSGGPDTIYRAADLNGDRDFEDAGELTPIYQAAPGASLQDPVQAPDGAIYVPDSGTNEAWRLVDLNGDGDAQDPGEARVFFGGGGVPLRSPGSVAIGLDGALYLADNGTAGASDSIWRLVDLDGNGDAQGPGEATSFNDFDYMGAIWGLSVDLRGRLWHTVTGPGGNLVVSHEDTDGDGRSVAAGERSEVVSTSDFVTDVVVLPEVAAWTGIGAARALRLTSGSAIFSDPTGSIGTAASVTAFADRRLLCSDLQGAVWRLEDRNLDGDYEDTDELFLALGTGTLARPYYSFAGRRPAPPRVTRPALGDLRVSGVAAPHASVHARAQGVALQVQAGADGRFDLPLPAALASGDRLELWVEALGGPSRSVTLGVR